MVMRLTIDQESDAAYVYVTDRAVALTQELDENRMLDLDDAGEVRGIEFLNVSHGVALVEAARRIAESDPTINDICIHCGEYVGLKTLFPIAACGEHAADCPWLSMPEIIRALELVHQAMTAVGDNAVHDEHGAARGFFDALSDHCLFCEVSSYGINPHWEWCEWPELVRLIMGTGSDSS